MSTPNILFANSLADETQMAFDRAAAELRAGRPIVIETDPGITIVAALDGIAPRVYETLQGLASSHLVVSAERARALGLKTSSAMALPLAPLPLREARELTIAPLVTKPEAWKPSDDAEAAALNICKYALLLPALAAARINDETMLPPGLYRVPLNRLNRPVGGGMRELEIVSEANVPLAGKISSRFVVLRGGPAPRDQVAVIVGTPEPSKPVPVRMHSACLTGDMFGSLRCDCGDQLRNAIARLNAAGGGVLLYLDQEGRGIGIGNKMRAYGLQDEGFDTIEADSILGFSSDERRYEYAAAMLNKLGYRRIILLTNNPAKIEALKHAGIEVVAHQSLTGGLTAENLHYLHTKARRANHMLDELLDTDEQLDLAEPVAEGVRNR